MNRADAALARITASRPDPATLGPRWRAFEAQVDGSFFTSWTWLGAVAAERFDGALLLEAARAGRTVAMALFNRRRNAAWLHETGDPALDTVFIEHNGVLAEPGEAATVRAMLQRARPRLGRLVLGGVDEATRRLAGQLGGVALLRAGRPAPFVDLAGLRRSGTPYLDAVSANTRYQLRRAHRVLGAVSVARADTVAQAHDWLAALAVLHQATWMARGKPGAFADPGFRRFHRAVIATGLPRNEIDLLRVDAAGTTIGYLYNFVWRGRVMSYQSGFDYAAASHPHAKPGLACHHAAIESALRDGRDVYDFLAGDDRYKTSMATGSTDLWWLAVVPTLSLPAARAAARALLGRPSDAQPAMDDDKS